MVTNAYNAYKGNSIMTASSHELTLMLYDGAIKFCNLAVKAIQEKDIPKAHENIMRAEDIIEHFQSILDHNYDVAKDLDEVYAYLYIRMSDANVTKDISILEEILGMLRELRDTWKEAIKVSARSAN